VTYKLFRHPQVAQDLLDIVTLIADYAGNAAAVDKLNQIEAAVSGLAENPHIGSLRNEIYPNLRAIPVAKKGVMTFIIDEEEKAVFIVSITYAGADWFKRIDDRT